jgi:hypothetical protein
VADPASSSTSEAQAEPSADTTYGAYYYAHDCGIAYERNDHWMSFFGRIANKILVDLAPGTMLDAGCAMGLLVEQLVLRGVDAKGIDVSEYAIGRAPDDVRDRCSVQSLTEPIKGQFDLVVTIEVLEHMEPADAELALDNICAVTDAVLFSSSPYDHGEPTHINVRPPESWARLFAQRGFVHDLDYDASYLTDWAVLYRRRATQPGDIVQAYERALWQEHVEGRQMREALLLLQERLERYTAEHIGSDSARVFRDQLDEERARAAALEEQLRDTKLRLMTARDTAAGLEATLGEVRGQIEQLSNLAQSREAVAAQLQAMQNSRSWKALYVIMGPYRRLRARRG